MKPLEEAEVEDTNKDKEDSNKKEESATKAEHSMMEEVDSTDKDSTTKVAEEAEASIQAINASNNHMVLPVTAAPLQPTKWDSSPIGTVVTLKSHVRILINVTQTKDGADNHQLTEKLSCQIHVQLLNSCSSNVNTVSVCDDH